LCPVLGIEEAKATASDLLELAKKTLLKTGKVVLASNYPEGCSFEDGFHLGYNEGYEQAEKDTIERVIDWLNGHINNYVFRDIYMGKEELKISSQMFDDLKKAMEDEK
jgi:hypothetical protein